MYTLANSEDPDEMLHFANSEDCDKMWHFANSDYLQRPVYTIVWT